MRALLALLLLALAGCGADEERPAEPAQSAPPGDTRLEVVVRPEGPDGPAKERTVTEAPDGLTAKDLAPTDPLSACTEIFGGPATATVEGTLRGEPVDAEFSRANGCEIARWDRAQALLGRVPGPTLP